MRHILIPAIAIAMIVAIALACREDLAEAIAGFGLVVACMRVACGDPGEEDW